MNDHKTHFCLVKGLFSFKSSPGTSCGNGLRCGSPHSHPRRAIHTPGPRGRLVSNAHWLRAHEHSTRRDRVRDKPTCTATSGDRRTDRPGRRGRSPRGVAEAPPSGRAHFAVTARTISYAAVATPPARSRRLRRAAGGRRGPGVGITPRSPQGPGAPEPAEGRTARLLATPSALRRLARW